MPNAEPGHQGIAAFHFRDAPTQRVGRFFHVGDDGREQMRDAFVDGKLEHLRVDHDQAHVLGRGLVEQAQHHGVQRNRLAGAGRAGNEQMGHPRQVGHDGLAADVLAERQRQRRLQRIVGLGFDDLAERDDLARLVGDLEPHIRLAGDDLHHPHADRRERTRQVLREIADLAAFDAGRGLQLEACHDGPGMHGDHFRLYAKIAELDLDEARHRLQRLGRVPALSRRRIVEQRQGRQLGRGRRLEKRHLPLAIDSLAHFDLLEHGLDARRAHLRLRAHSTHYLVSLLFRAAALQPGARMVEQNVELRESRKDGAPRVIHHGNPGHAGR